jgi:hypothetical protein
VVVSTFRGVVLPVLVATVVCAVVAGLVRGQEACIGALVGGVLVSIFLSASPAILEPATKANPSMSLLIALSLFGGKVAVLMVLLAVFVNIDSVSDHVDSTALGLTLLVTSMVSTGLQILAFTRARVPTYDLGNSSE